MNALIIITIVNVVAICIFLLANRSYKLTYTHRMVVQNLAAYLVTLMALAAIGLLIFKVQEVWSIMGFLLNGIATVVLVICSIGMTNKRSG